MSDLTDQLYKASRDCSVGRIHQQHHFDYLFDMAAQEIEGKESALNDIQQMVDAQAEDEGLWFIPESATEDYLQRALRTLTARIEYYTITAVKDHE